jgi:UDP-N-acetylmuramoylalanine--D-glutamate ligase
MNVPWSRGKWQRVLVYGWGISGLAAARFLRRRGVEVVAVDRRGPAALAAEVAAQWAAQGGLAWLPGEDAELPAGIDGVVVSPGVRADRPLLAAALARGIPVVAEIELAFPFLNGPLVAITGSNGKSTTTAMTGALLAAAGRPVEVCGNIGTALCARLEGPAGRVFVVEVSSFQLEAIDTFRPRAATILNLSPDHLDRHGGMAGYAAAKRRITGRQTAEDTLVLNADDPAVVDIESRAQRVWFSRRDKVAAGCTLEAGEVVGADGEALFAAADVPLAGPHNLENAMAAALLARSLGVSPADIARGLRSFRGLPHRMQPVATIGGVDFLDDSKGTNLDSTARGLEGFADRTVHLILGGRSKGADFALIAGMVARKAKRVYLIGEAAAEIESKLGSLVSCDRSQTLERAVAAAAHEARAGETVLLSPACASFDQFRDFNHRGDEFQRLVRSLPPPASAAARAECA